jgi:hypothetical protein
MNKASGGLTHPTLCGLPTHLHVPIHLFLFLFHFVLPHVKLNSRFCTCGVILMYLMWSYIYVSQILLKTLTVSVWRDSFDNEAYFKEDFD